LGGTAGGRTWRKRLPLLGFGIDSQRPFRNQTNCNQGLCRLNFQQRLTTEANIDRSIQRDGGLGPQFLVANEGPVATAQVGQKELVTPHTNLCVPSRYPPVSWDIEITPIAANKEGKLGNHGLPRLGLIG
jgi:hypothetical protein